ncbi:MAG: SDR family NAD(P)-dependent oxidoreductase [Dehalococcoidia bacterium]
MPIKHLDGKVAIVTGGAGGMGSWVCKIFAEQGAKVVVVDTGADVEGRMGMDPSKVNALVDEIKAAGGEATGSVGDVTEMAYAEEVVAKTIEQYGKLDILVCAHGILRERMIFNMLEDDVGRPD